eukprot:COSAG05_NODE_687_length_7922_cov_7.188035_4_plen_165_part_00
MGMGTWVCLADWMRCGCAQAFAEERLARSEAREHAALASASSADDAYQLGQAVGAIASHSGQPRAVPAAFTAAAPRGSVSPEAVIDLSPGSRSREGASSPYVRSGAGLAVASPMEVSLMADLRRASEREQLEREARARAEAKVPSSLACNESTFPLHKLPLHCK